MSFLPFGLSFNYKVGKYHSLISGDCNFSKNSTIISTYIDQLAYALVPHHSGLTEWDDYICDNNGDVVWIVTINNVASRPYAKIVRDIYKKGNELFVCDHVNTFCYNFEVK